MKTGILCLLAGLLLLAMTRCSKEMSVENNIDSSGTKADTTYQPLEAGSSWVYQDSATLDTTLVTATDSQSTINNKLYTLFHDLSSGQTVNEYFCVTSHNYYSYGYFGNGLVSVELLYLNDTASPGYNWQASAGTVNGFPAQVQGQIIDTGLTKVVAGKTYTHVIHTTVNLQYNTGSGFTTYAIYDYYIAKGIGIIRIESDFPTVGVYEVSNLVSYTIQ